MVTILEEIEQAKSGKTTRPRRGQRDSSPARVNQSASSQNSILSQIDRAKSDAPSTGATGQLARLGIGAAQGLESFLGGLVVKRDPKAPDLPTLSGFLEEISGQKVEPGKEGVAATVGQAIGGVAPSFILGATVGLPATIGVFAASNFGRAFKEAEEAGVDDNTKFAFAAANAGLAPLEAVPVGRTLGFLNRGTGGLVQKLATGSGSTSIKNIVENVAKTKRGRALLAVLQAAPEEGIQESLLSQVPENALARAFGVDPDRKLDEGAFRAALLGAIGGGIGAGTIAPFTGGTTDGRVQDEIQETSPTTTLESQPTQTQPEVQAQTGAEVGTGQGAQEVVTADQIPTGESIKDFTQPKATRVGAPKVDVKAGQRITSPEGTVITTPRQKDLREQANRVLGREVPVPSRFKVTGQDLANEARERGIVSTARSLASEINASSDPRILTGVEVMGLNERLNDLDRTTREIIRKIEAAQDNGDRQSLGADLERVRDEFFEIKNALDVTGSDAALALRARRFAIDEDMNLFTLEARAAASKGKPLTPGEREFFNQSVAQMDELSRNIAAAEERIRQLEAELRLKDKRPGRRARTRSRKKLDERIKDINRLVKAGCA